MQQINFFEEFPILLNGIKSESDNYLSLTSIKGSDFDNGFIEELEEKGLEPYQSILFERYGFSPSQSAIKEAESPDFCPKRWYDKYILKIRDNQPFSFYDAKDCGRYFENQVLGADAGKNGAIIIPKKKAGGDYKKQLDIDAVAKFAKEFFAYSNIVFEDIQVFLQENGFCGTLDFIGFESEIFAKTEKRLFLADLKWTGDVNGKWGDYQWQYPNLRQDLKIQAVHYTYLWYLKTGEILPFHFFVFDAGGDMKWIKVEFRLIDLILHQDFLQKVELKMIPYFENGFDAKPSYSKCKGCDFKNSCEKAMKFASCEKITFA